MVDLHVHSTASDGTFPPEELAEKGHGFALMAVTDHDNCEGGRRFKAACSKLRIPHPRWAGIELSLEAGSGHGDFHMLGLGLNPDSHVLDDFLDDIRKGREERNLKMLKKLQELGCTLAWPDVAKFAGGAIVARPHFARALIEKGYAADLPDAFERFLKKGSPAYVSRFHPDPCKAIALIHEAGGLAIWAHPNLWSPDLNEVESRAVFLKDAGLDGLEALYKSNLPGVTVEHLRLASRLGLLVTAGSDFHGANKPTLSLGMEVKDESAFMEPLLSRWTTYQTPQKA